MHAVFGYSAQTWRWIVRYSMRCLYCALKTNVLAKDLENINMFGSFTMQH